MENILEILTIQNQPSWIAIEYWNYFKFIPVFLVGFISTIILTPIIGQIASKYGVVNDTKDDSRNILNKHENTDRRINPNKVPLLGGLAVLIPFMIMVPLIFGLNETTLPILLALSFLVIGGILDDIYNMPATAQFAIQIIAALIIAVSVVDMTFIKIPFDGLINLEISTFAFDNFLMPLSFVFPGDLIMVLWIVIMINAIKWIGGVDALMEGNISIAFSLMFVIGIRTNNQIVALTSLFLFASILAFTFYNFPPAKIFSGSTGKSSYGFLIAVLAIINDTKVAVTIMILLVPLVDFIFVLVKRVLNNKPRSIKELLLLPISIMRMADTNHLHHQLLKLGLSFRQILLLEISVALAIGIVAVSITEAYRLTIVLFLSMVLALGIFLIHQFARRKEKLPEPEKEKDRESPESRYSY